MMWKKGKWVYDDYNGSKKDALEVLQDLKEELGEEVVSLICRQNDNGAERWALSRKRKAMNIEYLNALDTLEILEGRDGAEVRLERLKANVADANREIFRMEEQFKYRKINKVEERDEHRRRYVQAKNTTENVYVNNATIRFCQFCGKGLRE